MRKEDWQEINAASEIRKKLLKDKVFEYDYGELGEKLRPGHEFHEKLVRYSLDIADRGMSAVRPMHSLMRKMDWKCNGFVSPEDANPRNNSKDRPRNVVHTMSFAAEEEFCSAFQAVFNQDPVFRWKPFPGTDSLVMAATAEYMVQRQCISFDAMLHSDDIARVSFRYGKGMGNLCYRRRRKQRSVQREITEEALKFASEAMGQKLPRHLVGKIIRDMEEEVEAEGSEIEPWDMYNSYHDPACTPNKIDRAAFRGTTWSCEANELLDLEREFPGQWFNGWYTKLLAQNGVGISRNNYKRQSGREDKQGTTYADSHPNASEHFHNVDINYNEIRIVPAEWGIGDETYPVRYALGVGADEVVNCFYRLDLEHYGDNGLMMAPNADGQSFFPMGHVMSTIGIHDHVDHIFRTTQASMTKNVNGGLTIFNHNILNWGDYVASDLPGKTVRPIVPALTKEMMEAGIMQFPHMDNSAQNMQLIAMFEEIARSGNGSQQIGGPGELAGSERPTKFGMQAQVQSTSTRFRRLAFKIGAQYMKNLGWKMLHNMIQFGQTPQHVDLAGRFADRIRKQIGDNPTGMSFLADPRNIEIKFEMEPYSGAMPQTDDMSALSELLKVGMSIPEVAMEMTEGIPWAGVMKTFLRKNGVDNLDDYPEVEQVTRTPMPDEMVEEQAAAGNLVPIGQQQVI